MFYNRSFFLKSSRFDGIIPKLDEVISNLEMTISTLNVKRSDACTVTK